MQRSHVHGQTNQIAFIHGRRGRKYRKKEARELRLISYFVNLC